MMMWNQLKWSEGGVLFRISMSDSSGEESPSSVRLELSSSAGVWVLLKSGETLASLITDYDVSAETALSELRESKESTDVGT